MIKYIDNGETIKDRETGTCISKTGGCWNYREYLKWIDEGNTPIPQQPGPDFDLVGDAWVVNQDRHKQSLVAEIIATHKASVKEPVECVAGGKTYLMDGLEESAVKMKHGIELAELTGAESMDVVDYYNKVHEGVPLSECYEIMLQQAAFYLSAWKKKSKDRAAVLYPE